MNGRLPAFFGVATGDIVMPGADFAVVMRNALLNLDPPTEFGDCLVVCG